VRCSLALAAAAMPVLLAGGAVAEGETPFLASPGGFRVEGSAAAPEIVVADRRGGEVAR